MAVEDQRDDALVLVYTRNSFYRKKYHVALGVSVLALLVIAILIGAVAYLIKAPPSPLYFVTDNAGRLIQDPPLSQPNMTDEAVGQWVKAAVEAAYTYDFNNYRGQLQAAQKYFTDYGWRNYMKGLQASDNLVALTQRKWVVTAQVVGEPKLLATTYLGKAGVYAWKFEMPLLVSYYRPPYDDKSRIQNPLVITVIVARQSVLSSYQGLGIMQMIGVVQSS